MLDRLESKYATMNGEVPPISMLRPKEGGLSQVLSSSPAVQAITSAFQPLPSSDDPEVLNDSALDDADWFNQAASAENQGDTPTLDYPQQPDIRTGIEAPASFTPSTISESLNSVQDDIRRREASWGRLVNAGEQEWAQHENAAERAEAAAKIMAAEAKAAAAVHSAYITRAASTFQGVLMQNQVKQVVTVTELLGSPNQVVATQATTCLTCFGRYSTDATCSESWLR